MFVIVGRQLRLGVEDEFNCPLSFCFCHLGVFPPDKPSYRKNRCHHTNSFRAIKERVFKLDLGTQQHRYEPCAPRFVPARAKQARAPAAHLLQAQEL